MTWVWNIVRQINPTRSFSVHIFFNCQNMASILKYEALVGNMKCKRLPLRTSHHHNVHQQHKWQYQLPYTWKLLSLKCSVQTFTSCDSWEGRGAWSCSVQAWPSGGTCALHVHHECFALWAQVCAHCTQAIFFQYVRVAVFSIVSCAGQILILPLGEFYLD